MHVIGRANKELLLLLLSTLTIISRAIILLLLLLQLHVTVFIFAMWKRMVQTLRVVPCLLGTLLSIRTLCTWCLWQLEVVVTALSIWICRNCLHVQSTAIHGCVLRARSLLILRDLDIKRTCFIFIKKIIELVVCCAIQGSLMMCCATITSKLALIAEDALIISKIWWWLLKAVVVAKGSLYLMHVKTSIQVV